MAAKKAATILAQNRREAYDLASTAGEEKTRVLLEKAERQLRERIASVESLGSGEGSFTATQLRATLAQVELVQRDLARGMKGMIIGEATGIADTATEHVLDYLGRVDKEYRGLGTQGLALKEAAMFDQAAQGVNASVLRRLGSGVGQAQGGILARYGLAVVGQFEEQLQLAMVTRKPWDAVKAEITGSSPFLQGSPKFWAERIVRTELMGAYNRAGWESMRAADDQLGDMCKILCATFDNRTGADSYAVHGQIRRTDEAFESWFGMYQHPPNRPNDREVVVPHRKAWPIPDGLRWRSDGEVASAWRRNGRKGSPPGRPEMTTIPLDEFGRA